MGVYPDVKERYLSYVEKKVEEGKQKEKRKRREECIASGRGGIHEL